MIARLARACVRHRFIVIGAWLGLLVVVSVAAGAAGTNFRTDFTQPDSESKHVQDLLKANDPNRAGFTGQIVSKAAQGYDDPQVKATLTKLYEYAATLDGVSVSTPYDHANQISSKDPTIAFAQLDVSDRGFNKLLDLGKSVEAFGQTLPNVGGLTIEYGGDAFNKQVLPASEVYGVIAAVVILILAFGSVLAMGLPIGTALFGLGIGIGSVGLASHLSFLMMPDFTTSMVAMIGLGVGIDYALFIVTRYREGLRAGLDVEDAVVEAMDTSGRAVLFAGITVIIALLGLCAVRLKFVTAVAVGSTIGVLVMVVAAMTLLPALLGWVGRRIDHTTRAALAAVTIAVVGAVIGVVTHQPPAFLVGMVVAVVLFVLSFKIRSLRTLIPHRADKPKERAFWYRWSRFVQHRPWQSAIGATLGLLLLAVPLLSIRLGFSDLGNLPKDRTTRRAYDLIADGFGAGVNGPLIIAVEGPAAADADRFYGFIDTVERTPDIAFATVPPREAFHPGAYQAVVVYPDSAPQDKSTTELVQRLRADVIPGTGVDATVGGLTAASVDFADYLGSKMPLLLGAVLIVSFLLLMLVFRSILVPLKAVVMNLLSIGAAYGVLVAIFQWGWGMRLIGVDKAGPIEAWVPMFLFAIVFGLSMDYEVFLLSRMKEEYDRTKDNNTAVADGLAVTARVITAAALIMFFVFGAFVLGDDRQLKLFGLGLAVAVLLDATIVRMLLVPATMELLGDRNWWFPRWLRWLPRIDVEGHHPVPTSQPTSDPDELTRV